MATKTRISKNKTIHVSLSSGVRMLEEACEQARWKAMTEFGCDEDGYANKVKGWERSCCCIQVEFKKMTMSGGMTGWDYCFEFVAWCEKYNDEDD